jgi:hypothetical protein
MIREAIASDRSGYRRRRHSLLEAIVSHRPHQRLKGALRDIRVSYRPNPSAEKISQSEIAYLFHPSSSSRLVMFKLVSSHQCRSHQPDLAHPCHSRFLETCLVPCRRYRFQLDFPIHPNRQGREISFPIFCWNTRMRVLCFRVCAAFTDVSVSRSVLTTQSPWIPYSFKIGPWGFSFLLGTMD